MVYNIPLPKIHTNSSGSLILNLFLVYFLKRFLINLMHLKYYNIILPIFNKRK